MTTKEFANMFDMTVNDMCKLTGYSRDGLNDIVQGRSTKKSLKKESTMWELLRLADEIYRKERAKVCAADDDRKYAILAVFNN